MAGINLSQSIQAKQAQAKVRFFDQGLIAMVGVLALLLITYGGTRWYLNRLEKRVASLETEVTERTASLKGKEVDRVADFVERLGYISTHMQEGPDPSSLLGQLEQMTLPAVRLTAFEYGTEEPRTRIEGETNSLKEVAQQMMVYKQLPGIAEVTVERVEYNKEGRIIFTLVLKRDNVVSVPSPTS